MPANGRRVLIRRLKFNACVFQVPALVTALVTLCLATPPPGYVKKPDNDKVS